MLNVQAQWLEITPQMLFCELHNGSFRPVSVVVCRARPPTKPQWPPCGVTISLMYGLAVTRGSRNGPTGTNGSSSAVMISAGTRMRSIDPHRARRGGSSRSAPLKPKCGAVYCSSNSRTVRTASRCDEFEAPRVRDGFPPHPRLQVADEVPLINDVLLSLERFDARAELHHGRDGADRLQRGGAASPYSPASFSARLPPSE